MTSHATTDEKIEYIEDTLEEYGADMIDAEAVARECFDELLITGELGTQDIHEWIQNYALGLENRDIDNQLDEVFEFDEFENDNSFRIGGAYKGVRHIAEHETPIYYCPSDNYCVFKCIERYYEIIGKKEKNGTPIKFPTYKLNPYYNSKKKYLDVIMNVICPKREGEKDDEYYIRGKEEVYKLPAFVYIEKTKDKKITLTRVDNNHKISNCPDYRIGLLNVDNGIYHAILLKCKGKDIRELKTTDFKLKFTNDLELVSDWVKMTSKPPKARENLAIIYDIETSIHTIRKTIAGRERDVKVFIPEGLAYRIIEFEVNPDTRELDYKFHENHEIFCTPGLPNDQSDLYDNWFSHMKAKYDNLLSSYCLKSENNEKTRPIQVWAHNGSRFDNIFLRSSKKIKFIDEIKAGSMYKSIRCSHESTGNIEFLFKDTLPFCLANLKSIAKTLKCTPKDEFDIADWTREKYMLHFNSEDPAYNWRKYMKQDVDTLSEVFIKLEGAYNKIGCSLTNTVGLPGVAYELMSKTCYGFTKNMYRPKDPSMVALIKNAMYGGRVVAYKRHFSSKISDDVLICLDANSLYPSVMCIGSYPVGKPKKINSFADNQAIKDKKIAGKKSKFTLEEMRDSLQHGKHEDGRSKLCKHYILTIRFRIPNIPQTLVPYKDEGRLYYPTNGIYEGSYNDVDIREMLIDGYEIIEVINGIYWATSERLFSELINYLYTKRQELKKEGNFLEYVYKIIINAMYGKLLESVDSKCYFKTPKDENKFTTKFNEKIIKLANGQFEITQNLRNPMIKKPMQLGTYVLAYARAVMNQYIRKVGIENVFYTDTDSIYVLKKAFEKSGIKESLELGGVKNDYGDSVYITEAFFLDQKRYFLQKVKSPYKHNPDISEEENKKLQEEAIEIAIKKFAEDYDKAKLIEDPKKKAIAINSLKDPAPISAKYVGLSFRAVIKGIISNEAGECVWGPDQKSEIRRIYEDILKNYNEFVMDSKEDSKATIKKVLRVMEKWRRVTDGVNVMQGEMQFCIAPHKKGLYLPSDIYNHVYHSLGFDKEAPTAKLGNKWGDIKKYCERFRLTAGYVYKNAKGGLTVNSILPFTSPKIKGVMINKDAKKSECDEGDRVLTNYYLHIAKNGIKSIIYCYRGSKIIRYIRYGTRLDGSIVDSDLKKALEFEEKNGIREITLSSGNNAFVQDYVQYFNTCILGATVEIHLSPEEENGLIPLFGTSESGFLLKNNVYDREFIILNKTIRDLHLPLKEPLKPRSFSENEEFEEFSDDPIIDDTNEIRVESSEAFITMIKRTIVSIIKLYAPNMTLDEFIKYARSNMREIKVGTVHVSKQFFQFEHEKIIKDAEFSKMISEESLKGIIDDKCEIIHEIQPNAYWDKLKEKSLSFSSVDYRNQIGNYSLITLLKITDNMRISKLFKQGDNKQPKTSIVNHIDAPILEVPANIITESKMHSRDIFNMMTKGWDRETLVDTINYRIQNLQTPSAIEFRKKFGNKKLTYAEIKRNTTLYKIL